MAKTMNNEEVTQLGDKLYEQGKFEEAFAVYLKAAKNGDLSSMTQVANMLTCGEGVDCNFDNAIEWELKAIEGGEISAMVNVGISYRMKGEIKKSKYWFEQALEKGNGSAALELAKIYMVSDKEKETIKEYLNLAINNTNMCEADIEEAQQLLTEVK